MSKKEIKKIEEIIKTVERLSPYMPPSLQGTEYLFLHQDILYLASNSENVIYQERLGKILQEEFDFIQKVEFIKKGEYHE
jgi:hypothetical protein